MKPTRWVPLMVLFLAAGSVLGPASAMAEQGERAAASAVSAKAPTCMKQKTYKKIEKRMRYAEVVDIIKGQKAAFKGPADQPYFIYEACWTDDGVLLQYYKKFFTDPLRKAILDRKGLNPCGLRPSC